MMFLRLGRLPVPVLCSAALLFGIGVQHAAAQNPQQQQQQPPKPPNPFETVPEGKEEPAKPAQPSQPTPPPAAQQPARVTRPGQNPDNVIEAIEFRGARRVRQDT